MIYSSNICLSPIAKYLYPKTTNTETAEICHRQLAEIACRLHHH